MENNKFLAVLLGILLFSVGIAGAENIDRPWKNDYSWEKERECIGQPPPCYILYHDQLELLNLDGIETGNQKIDEFVDNAISEKYNADAEYENADREYSELVHKVETAPFSIVQRCTFGGAVGTIGGPMGVLVGCVANMFLLMPELEVEHAQVVTALEEYNPHWTEAMDNAVGALELSVDNAAETVGNSRKTYNKLKEAGLCDDDYTWEPGASCKKLENAINTIDSGDEGSVHGRINNVYKNIQKLEEQLKEPNTTLYYPTMEMIWGEEGVVPVYSDLTAEGESAFAEAEDIYDEITDEIEELRGDITDASATLEFHELDSITESKTTEGVAAALEAGAGTIAEKYEEFENAKESGDELYEDAKDSKTAGDVADATIGMDDAKEIYESLDAESIIDDAESVVLDKKEEADDAIENAELYIETNNLGTEASGLLDTAKEKRDDADSSKILGERYVFYVEAIELANSVSDERTVEEEIAYERLVEEVETLLAGAETDGIYVADLGEEFEYIETTNPANAESWLKTIKGEIGERARLAYGYLQGERDELYERLAAAGADDLLDDLEDAERGLVYGGRIDYLGAVGNLKILAEKYDEIADDLEIDEQKRNDALANQLVVETSLLIGDVKIDDATDVTYVISVMNPKSYGGYEIEVRVPLKGEINFMYSDAVSGSEDLLNVRTEGKNMYLLFGEIGAFEREVVSFEKSAILARTRSIETEAVGLGDGTAKVDETVVFELDIDDGTIEIPYGYSGILIDGLDPNRPLTEGVHSMTGSYTEYDAYTEARTDAVVGGTDTEATISYDITVEPAIDLVKVPLFADIGTDEYVTEVSIDCGIYDCVEQSNGGAYTITVYDLMEGLSAVVNVDYTVSNLDDYITLQLNKYRNSEELEIQELVDEAESYLLAGNNGAALQKLEELKKKYSEIEKEKAKLLKKYYELSRKINNEIEDLETALAKSEELGITNNSEVMKLETRKQSLENELLEINVSDDSTKDEIQSAVDDLGKIDMNWLKKEVTAISKQAGKDFEDYKEEFAEYDNANATSLLKQLETDINVLLATDKATDMVIVISDLEKAGNLLAQLESGRIIKLENLQTEFDDIKDTAEALLVKYESEYNDAKKYSMESIFPVTPKSVSSLLSKTEKLVEDENIREASHNIEKEIPEVNEKMQDTLKLLSSNAYRKLDEIDYELEIKRAEFSGEQIAQIEKMKTDAEAALSAGDYVLAIKKAGEAINYIKDTKGKGNTALYLVLASLLIVAALGGYLIYQKKKKPKMKSFGKLKKSKDEPQEPEKEKPASL